MGHKILLLGSSSGVGLTFHFTRLAAALKKMGESVTVLSDTKEQYPELRNELSKLGIGRYVSDAIDNSDVISVARGIKDIRTVLKGEGDFDVIHGGGVKHGLKMFFAKRGFNKKPMTFATIGFLPESKMGMHMANLSYSLFYDQCVALCHHSKVALVKSGVNPDKIHVIPLFAPDLEWFDKAKKIGVYLEDYNLRDLTKPVIFYAASHFHSKGFPYYLMAAFRILKKHDATFVVGGRGPLATSLKKLAERLGISEHVVFTGWISNYHMPYVLSSVADICVSTSLVEQLPSYVMECMAAGKPMVAACTGGVPELITNELNGYLVPACDDEETAQRITDLLDDPRRAREMGFASRKIIEERLNMKRSVSKLMKIYEELT